MKLWMRVVAALAVVWILAAGIAWMARSAKPTPESLAIYIVEHPLENASPAERAKTIERVAEQLNRLEYKDRRKFRRDDALDVFFKSLTEEERTRFLNLTLPEGFRQIMLALNKMTPEERKRIVDRALSDLEEDSPLERDEDPLTESQRVTFIEHGMSAFYEEASAEVKLDFAPVIEQIQRRLQHRE